MSMYNKVPITRAIAPKIKYKVPISLWLVDINHLSKKRLVVTGLEPVFLGHEPTGLTNYPILQKIIVFLLN